MKSVKKNNVTIKRILTFKNPNIVNAKSKISTIINLLIILSRNIEIELNPCITSAIKFIFEITAPVFIEDMLQAAKGEFEFKKTKAAMCYCL